MKTISEWSDVAEMWHELLRGAVVGHRNTEMQTVEINQIVEKIPDVGKNVQFIQPSDHCINITNRGACPCAKTDRALFKQIRRGVYLVL
jgi:hypothetical protein